MQTEGMSFTRALPAALFDALKTRADAAGGVGYWFGQGANFPSCLGDYAAAVDGFPSLATATSVVSPSLKVLRDVLGPYFGSSSDNAVVRVNRRKGAQYNAKPSRVTFDELVAELGLVRGEA
jgi:hypothetical protein